MRHISSCIMYSRSTMGIPYLKIIFVIHVLFLQWKVYSFVESRKYILAIFIVSMGVCPYCHEEVLWNYKFYVSLCVTFQYFIIFPLVDLNLMQSWGQKYHYSQWWQLYELKYSSSHSALYWLTRYCTVGISVLTEDTLRGTSSRRSNQGRLC